MRLPTKVLSLIASGSLVLTSCVAWQEGQSERSQETEVAVLSNEKESADLDQSESALMEVLPRPKPRPVGFHPQKLMELEPNEVSRILGDPNSVQHRAPALIWSYLAESCSLDIVFYATVDGDRFEALQYIVKNGVLQDGVRGAILSKQASDNVSCVSDVLAKNQISPLKH